MSANYNQLIPFILNLPPEIIQTTEVCDVALRLPIPSLLGEAQVYLDRESQVNVVVINNKKRRLPDEESKQPQKRVKVDTTKMPSKSYAPPTPKPAHAAPKPTPVQQQQQQPLSTPSLVGESNPAATPATAKRSISKWLKQALTPKPTPSATPTQPQVKFHAGNAVSPGSMSPGTRQAFRNFATPTFARQRRGEELWQLSPSPSPHGQLSPMKLEMVCVSRQPGSTPLGTESTPIALCVEPRCAADDSMAQGLLHEWKVLPPKFDNNDDDQQVDAARTAQVEAAVLQ
eukprot:TRINITY_DN5870_c0_g1_i1.p1 TRINITY_DN5870_c0_g1~~TRINITY_DN5870_c0_g1_i1.p1  ORF type:complete len:287 (-),score=71.70 TRINITY_DN5870_c0_g1_i1:95-955(-)